MQKQTKITRPEGSMLKKSVSNSIKQMHKNRLNQQLFSVSCQNKVGTNTKTVGKVPFAGMKSARIPGSAALKMTSPSSEPMSQKFESKVIDVEASSKKVYEPKVINNKFSVQDVNKNPLKGLTSIFADVRGGKAPQPSDLQDLLKTSQTYLSDRKDKIKEDPKYWGYSALRTGFFLANGFYTASQNKLDSVAFNKQADGIKDLSPEEQIQKEKDHYERWVILVDNYELMANIDAQNIKDGYYRAPWTGKKGHRELNPLWAIKKSKEFLKEAKLNLERRARDGRKELPFVSGMYPEYYMNNFHFQSDGWLSSRSASIYEFSTEVLFSGSQDAMQRQILVPLKLWLDDYKKEQGKEEKDLKALEVAGGTGRFMTFFRDNYPEVDATLLELSPFYLEEAGKNDRYFRKVFERSDERKETIGELAPLNLAQGNAENMDIFEDESFDILNSIYLFHELPTEARQNCVKEFYRVLKPGGIVCFNDSIQEGDREDRQNLKKFDFTGRYNEPHYDSYIDEDLFTMFFEAGFKPGPTTQIIAQGSKALSFVKPLPTDSAEDIKDMQQKWMDIQNELKVQKVDKSESVTEGQDDVPSDVEPEIEVSLMDRDDVNTERPSDTEPVEKDDDERPAGIP